MIVAVPREPSPREKRVALTPAGVATLAKRGVTCRIETGAGQEAGFPDTAYEKAGAEVLADRTALLAAADVCLRVRPHAPGADAAWSDLDALPRGAAVVALADPLENADVAREYASRGLMLFAMELLPRISRAQSMDVLSSSATIAGYKAAVLAAHEAPRLFPLLMTAAGTLTPAKVFVIGAGVAGLQAIATARRLGAVVSAYDVRPAAREQIESVGATAVELAMPTGDGGEAGSTEGASAEDAGGYAKRMDDDQQRLQQEALAKVIAEVDVVITTASVPGGRAPQLVTAAAVEAMRPGSVIVDLAAERGGNCELTRADEPVTHHGVRVLGPTDLIASAPRHASQMYSTNLVNFLGLLAPEGELAIDFEDEIVRGTLVTRDGEVVHPRVRELAETAG